MSDERPFDDLPRGHFGAILADPPWSYVCFSEKGMARSADRHYVTMAADAIEQLPVERACRMPRTLISLDPGTVPGSRNASPDYARVGLRALLNRIRLDQAQPKRVANGGFLLDETLFAKGLGHTTRQNAEYVVLGRRGKPRRLRKDVHQLIIQPRREHCRKPDEFYARVERYCTGPYLELFARQRRPGWTAWGDESTSSNPNTTPTTTSPNR